MDEFTVVASSWQYGSSYAAGLVFFAMADYDEAPDVFTSVGSCVDFSLLLLKNLL
jgi:hypothetical protein